MRYSINQTTDGRYVAVVDSDILSKIDTSSWDDAKKAKAKDAASDALKQFSDGIVVDGITRKVNKISRNEYTRSNDTEKLYRTARDVFADKMRAADIADDIVIAATNWKRDGALKHPRKDNFVDFDHGKVLIASGNAKYNAEIVVGITSSGDAVFYDVIDMTPTVFDIKKTEPSTAVTTQNAPDAIQEDSVGINVSQNDADVKRSLSSADEMALVARAGEVYGRDIGIDAPVREDLDSENVPESDTDGMEAFDAMLDEIEIRDTRQRLDAIREHSQQELEANQKHRQEAKERYDRKIAKAQQQYDAKKNKESKYAQPHTVHIL